MCPMSFKSKQNQLLSFEPTALSFFENFQKIAPKNYI